MEIQVGIECADLGHESEGAAGLDRIVMRDPEGDELCLCDA